MLDLLFSENPDLYVLVILKLSLSEGSINKLIKKNKLVKTASGFPGSEK